uniref:Crossover junction endonuclease MUS81 n=1 Tax=Varanus komodoensis TaxID=61221 RepID=A0A8D2LHG9_VARKO
MPGPPRGCPNPLFTRWLQEWRDQAAERGRVRTQRAYERALSSLRKYPLPLRSGREARILQYFGERICRQLDEQLEKHRGAQDAAGGTGELDQERPLQAGDGSCRLLTFPEFNQGAVKNKAQTVSEVFARQLLQISGISGDKAAAILERYKTPASLLAAYAACQTPRDQEQLLSSIKCGKLQRNLGPALSKTVAQLYCTQGPLP